MHLFTAPDTPIPRTAIDWNALPPEDLQSLWNAWGRNMPVDVAGSHLLNVLPSSVFTWRVPDGEEDASPSLDHYKIEFFYARVCTLAADVVYDLRHAFAPHVFDRVEAHLLEHNFDFSATSADIFVQRLQIFAISNVRLVLSDDDFILLEPFGELQDDAAPAARATRQNADAAPPGQIFQPDPLSRIWPAKLRIEQLVVKGTLDPYSVLVALLGPRLRRADRLAPGGQFQIAVAALKSWSTQFDIDDVQMLGPFLAQKLKYEIPFAIASGDTDFPSVPFARRSRSPRQGPRARCARRY